MQGKAAGCTHRQPVLEAGCTYQRPVRVLLRQQAEAGSTCPQVAQVPQCLLEVQLPLPSCKVLASLLVPLSRGRVGVSGRERQFLIQTGWTQNLPTFEPQSLLVAARFGLPHSHCQSPWWLRRWPPWFL